MNFDGLTILLRHFPTQDEIEDKVSASIATPSILNEALHHLPILIEQLKLFLNRVEIKTVYCSDSYQALQTANLLTEKLPLKVKPTNLLRNIDRPLWEGLTNSDIREKFTQQFDLWTTYPGEVRFEKGESIQDVRKRVRQFNEAYNEAKIVITHTTTFHSFMLENFELESNKAWDFKPEMYTFSVLFNGTLWALNTRNLDYLTLDYK